MQLEFIIPLAFSPLVAVLVSMWIQDRKEKRQHQMAILTGLIATRHEPLSSEAVRSLNMIDLVFHNRATVRRLWHEYFDMLSNEGLNNPIGMQQRLQKYIELVTEMANALGYGKTISHLDVGRVYSPQGVQEQWAKNQELLEELIRVLKATARLEVVLK